MATSPNSIEGRSQTSRRRSSIRTQLFVPMLVLVVGTTAVATATTALWLARSVRRQHHEELRGVIRTLSESSFPLTNRVLEQMKGLSGLSFILVGQNGDIVASTFAERVVQTLPAPSAGRDVRVTIQGVEFLAHGTAILRGRDRDESLVLYVLRPLDALTQRVYEVVFPAIATGTIATIVASLLATWLARRFVEPINDLAKYAVDVADGNFGELLEPRRNDELGDLAESINSMSSHLSNFTRQLRSTERMETLMQIGAALVHQLRNSATGGRMAIELHRRDCPKKDGESLTVALRQLELMDNYLRQFLVLGGKQGSTNKVALELRPLLANAVALLRPMAQHVAVELTVDTVPALWIRGNDEALRQLVTNLVINGIEAAVATERRPRRVEVRLSARGSRGLLTVADSGAGVDPAMASRVFEPLVTDKKDGVGLGLYVARHIAEFHDGNLSYERTVSTTVFRFEFPVLKRP